MGSLTNKLSVMFRFNNLLQPLVPPAKRKDGRMLQDISDIIRLISHWPESFIEEEQMLFGLLLQHATKGVAAVPDGIYFCKKHNLIGCLDYMDKRLVGIACGTLLGTKPIPSPSIRVLRAAIERLRSDLNDSVEASLYEFEHRFYLMCTLVEIVSRKEVGPIDWDPSSADFLKLLKHDQFRVPFVDSNVPNKTKSRHRSFRSRNSKNLRIRNRGR